MRRLRNSEPREPNAKRSVSARALAIAAGIATLAVAVLVFLAWRGSWWAEPDLAQPTHSKSDAASSPAGGRSLAEGPAAAFQAELYGMVTPLVEKLPDSPQARCLLAAVHRRFARGAEAERELQQSLALDPACAEAHYWLGIMAAGAGDYSQGEKHFRDAFDNDPAYADVTLQLAQAQTSQGKFRAAVSTLETYLTVNTEDAEAWCQLGQAYQSLGDFPNAKRCHLTALDVAPNSPEACYGVAIALRELGHTDESRDYLERFRQLRSTMTAGVRSNKASLNDEDFMRAAVADMAARAGAVWAMHGHLAEAEQCWNRATELDPANARCLEMLCRLKPDDPERWMRLGRVYIEDGRPAEAELPFQRVIELAPQRAGGYAALAEVYVRLDKDADRAVQLARRAVELEAEPAARTCFVLAAACERAGDLSGAESALRRAIELDPADPQSREALARLRKGKPE